MDLKLRKNQRWIQKEQTEGKLQSQLRRISPCSSLEFEFFLPLAQPFNITVFSSSVFQLIDHFWYFMFNSFDLDFYIFYNFIFISNITYYLSLVSLHFASFLPSYIRCKFHLPPLYALFLFLTLPISPPSILSVILPSFRQLPFSSHSYIILIFFPPL